MRTDPFNPPAIVRTALDIEHPDSSGFGHMHAIEPTTPAW